MDFLSNQTLRRIFRLGRKSSYIRADEVFGTHRRVSLLGAWLNHEGMVNVAEWACREADVPMPWRRLPDGIEVSCREAADRRIHVICNHAAQERAIHLPFEGTCVLTGRSLGCEISLPRNDLFVIREQ